MSRFTKVSKYRTGQPRFAGEPGDEPANSPVVTYRLSPEEVAARYGPPVQRETRRQLLTRENLAEMLATRTVGQIAERHRVPQKIIFDLAEKYGLKLDDKNRLINEEAINMASVMETARSILPAQTLGTLFAAGKTGTDISKEYDLPSWAVSKLKNEYWPDGVGFNPDNYRYQGNENQDTGNSLPNNENDLPENENDLGENANELAAELDGPVTADHEDMGESAPDPVVSVLPLLFDFGAFTWVVPHRFGGTKMILKVRRDRVVLTSAATKALSPAGFIKIGVDGSGILAIVPAANGAEGYKLPGNKSYSNLGGGNLVRFLGKHGYGPGEYELEPVNGCLVATRR